MRCVGIIMIAMNYDANVIQLRLVSHAYVTVEKEACVRL